MALALAGRRRLDLIVREARDYRSRERMRIGAAAAPWPPGMPVNAFGNIAAPAATIVALTLEPVDATRGPVEDVLVLARDAEVNDNFVVYYDHIAVDPDEWNARLAELGIIVRPGVFPVVRWLPAGARLDFPPDGGGRAELVPVPGAPGSPQRHVFEARLFGLAIAFGFLRQPRRRALG